MSRSLSFIRYAAPLADLPPAAGTQPSAHSAHYRPDIDGLRAIAVLLVLWFHGFPETLSGGFVGVDVFFVISGYLITGIILRGTDAGTFSFLHFYAQRARRLLPSLTVVLAAVLGAGWYWLWPAEFEQLATHAAAATAFIVNIVLWRESGYFDTATELKPLMHLWSLSVEEQFYLLYPCFLWLTWRFGIRRIVPILVVLGGSFALNMAWLQHDPSGTFFLPVTRFWEPAAGGALAWLQHVHRHAGARNTLPPWRQALPAAGLAAIAVAAFTLSGDEPYPGIRAVLPVAGAAAVIAAGPSAWLNRRIFAHRALVWVGLISYPLYLWHWPLLAFARLLHADTPPPLLRAGLMAAAVLLAWLTYRYVETPVRFGAKRRLRLGLTLTGLGVACAAAVTIRMGDGIPSRLPDDMAAMLAYRVNLKQAYRETTCFLDPDQDAPALDACPDPWPGRNGTWLLWGDSHAAHLYPGLRETISRDGPTLVQRTASGCPPLEGETIMHAHICSKVRERIWQEIAAHPPEKVTLAAFWTEYQWSKLRDTVQRLRALGVREIEIVGPVPR